MSTSSFVKVKASKCWRAVDSPYDCMSGMRTGYVLKVSLNSRIDKS